MKVLLFGGTGMIGSGVLIECLADPRVESVLSVVRSRTTRAHPKLTEIPRADFFDFHDLASDFAECDACFYCLGVSSAGMSEAEYHRLTYDLTIALAGVLAHRSPKMTFCFVSGTGADSSETGRLMWARVKGKTENELFRMSLDTYVFRPGIVQPMKGVTSRTPLYRVLYDVTRPLIPLLRRALPDVVTTTENIGKAMIRVAEQGDANRLFENRDINRLATSP